MGDRMGMLIVAWPALWKTIAWIYRCMPGGRLQNAFKDVVFTRPWKRYYKSAYVPELRDLFFEYIATFVYDYPIKKRDVVVQVGASFGEETARFARAVGRCGRVIALEPEGENIRRLKETFRAEVFPQITIIPQGAWSQRGEARFFRGGEREHRIGEIPAKELTFVWWGIEYDLRESNYKDVVVIPVDTLDNILEGSGLNAIDFILIETNGSEYEVLKGMEKTLERTKRLAIRGHVKYDGVPINRLISSALRNRGFETTINSEGMVIASRRQRGV
jgi:FkbM family methyltransferase